MNYAEELRDEELRDEELGIMFALALIQRELNPI
jgi:hypothetical protein